MYWRNSSGATYVCAIYLHHWTIVVADLCVGLFSITAQWLILYNDALVFSDSSTANN